VDPDEPRYRVLRGNADHVVVPGSCHSKTTSAPYPSFRTKPSWSRYQAANRVGSRSTRGLGTIARRLEKALSTSSAGLRSRRSTATAATATRRSAVASKARKPASPETQVKRLAALAKARAARAEKRAQTAQA
jgi:hypothetical protein